MKTLAIAIAFATACAVWMFRWSATNAINVGGNEAVYVLDRWTGQTFLLTGNETFKVLTGQETIELNRDLLKAPTSPADRNAWGDPLAPK